MWCTHAAVRALQQARAVWAGARKFTVASLHLRCAGFGTADEFIEKEVVDLMAAKERPLVYVATSDRASGDTSAGAGAIVISSAQLLRYVQKCDDEAKEVLRRNKAESKAKEGRRVLNRLPSSTSQSLMALRARLNEEAKLNNRNKRGR